MRILLRFAHGVDRISNGLGAVAASTVFVMIAVGFYNVVARYVGRSMGLQLASNLWIESQWYLYSVCFFLAFPYILLRNDNVRVDFWYANWSIKRKAWVDLLGTVLFLIPFCLIGIYVTISPVLYSWGRLPNGAWGTWEVSPDPGGLPRAPIKSLIIIAFVMLLLQAISQVIKYVAVLTEHSEVAAELQEETSHPELVD